MTSAVPSANGLRTGIVLPRRAPAARTSLRNVALPMLDPLRTFRRRRPVAAGVPCISVPGCTDRVQIPPCRERTPDDPIDAARLRLRLRAVAAVLEDLPAVARRFARRQAVRDARGSKVGRTAPLKPGRPPGWKKRPFHAVHEVLNEAHWLACAAPASRDTS